MTSLAHPAAGPMLFPEPVPTPYTHPMYIPTSPSLQANPRKRAAPGTVPIPAQQSFFTPNPTPDAVCGWNGNNAGGFIDNSTNNASFGVMTPPTPGGQFPGQPAVVPPSSTALARRAMNNQVVPTNRPFNPSQSEGWPSFGDETALAQANGTHVVEEHDTIEALEERAQRAKRDAQGKRKQIPPFVQKLNSFLEESKNTELIRWSEKGDSFIVLDEDEFAKTLIPELFKHNNYASFVRQLNMYGFHKKVGLSDNSMKASERKNKSPSEYYNPYFRRGHPNLLWLINKPKSGTSRKKSKRPDEGGELIDSDEDVVAGEEAIGQGFGQHNAAATRALPAPESGPLQKKDLAVVRDQVQNLQDQQRQIKTALERFHAEHVQLTKQAIAFQEMHSRHENSINAILNFLANVFRKSLEEQGGTSNVNDILASIMNPGGMPGSTPNQQGSVVDLGEYVHQQPVPAPSNTPPGKRAQRLLPPIPQIPHIPQVPQQARAMTRSPSAGGTTLPYRSPPPPQVTELFDTPHDVAGTPNYLKQELESNPQEGMMKIIQDANNAGRGSSPGSLPNMTSPSPRMPEDQRSRMLNIMSGGNGNAPSPNPAAAFNAATTTEPVSSAPPANNSLSPLLGSSVPPPSAQQLSAHQDEWLKLQRLQHEQDQKLESLSSLLGPLSPSGRIPGLTDAAAGNDYFDGDIDFGQYLDHAAYNPDGTTGAADFDFGTAAFVDNANFDFGTDGVPVDFGNGAGAGGANLQVDAQSPVLNGTPSSNGTEEIPRDDLPTEDSPGRATKRQRRT